MRPDRPPVPFFRHAGPELLPCPFCGGPARTTAADCGDHTVHMVECAGTDTCPAYVVVGPYFSAADAAENWKKRA